MSSPFPTFFRKPAFKFQIQTTEVNETFELPINFGGAGYVHNFIVTWGDTSTNVITSYDDEDRIHIYVTPGIYNIELKGTCEYLGFNGSIQLTKILSFIGDMGFKLLSFYSCSNLTEICIFPKFNSLDNSQGYRFMFSDCINLLSIPLDLFRYNTEVTTFNGVFSGCSALTSIPIDLFRYNTEIINFSYAFRDCVLLEEIPIDLFRYNTEVTTFEGAFAGCSALTSIPIDLFRYNTEVTTFDSVFGDSDANCISLILIPTDLFTYNTKVIYFSYAFRYAVNLTGNAPTLWLREPPPVGYSCFDGCINLTNYADIPVGWKS